MMSVDEIVRRVAGIDAQIRALHGLRVKVLRQDPAYAEYLDAFDFDACGDGGPPFLSIVAFHRATAELEEIGAVFAGADPMSPEFDGVWQRHHERLVELEGLLLA